MKGAVIWEEEAEGVTKGKERRQLSPTIDTPELGSPAVVHD